ncbi:hypothetical protein ABT297_07870 [Dactylosporangium sp. NPDC000555]|uniref:hypothetical protein n=1 Tax=Dactylosporangium sp. NPDC000555 TaxID=3154260 RepID=UPI00332502CF
MPLHRFWRKRAVALSVSASAATAAIVAGLPHVAYGATLPGTITITSPTTGKIAAGTDKQVLLLTVAGQTLSEALVTGVNLGADPDCQNISSYVVTSATTIAVKTPTGGCPATTAPTGDNIDIVFAGNNTVRKTGGLYFVTPPAIAAVSNKPVINENSALLLAANQITRFVTSGGQTVRVKADANYAFDPRASAGLGVTFGGKPVTELKVYDSSGTQVLATTTTAPAVGNYLTFKTGAGMSANDSSLTVTQNGVSKTFSSTDTGVSVVAAPTVTSLSVTSGKIKAPVSTIVTGANFSKTLADYTGTPTWKVNFCNTAGTVTAINAAGTTLTVTTPDVSNDVDGLGTGVYAGTCPVTIVDVTNSITSPISAGGYFNFLNE